jgi:Fe-S oxidoreductase
LIDWNEESVGVIFAEVDGGNSRDHCVFDQPFEEATAAVRAQLVRDGLAPPVVEELRHQLVQYQTPYGDEPPMAAVGQGEVALFVGDEGPYLWPTAVPAALTLLADAGVEPALVGQGRNSGLFAHSLGLPGVAADLAQATIDEIAASGAKTLLVLSAGDYYAWTDGLTERLGLALPAGVTVQEVGVFLAGKQTAQPVADAPPSAYVDPTHAVRVHGRHEPLRELAAPLLGEQPLELFWRAERAQPVGSTYIQFTRPDVAETLTRARLADAQAQGAARLLCDDPATLYQLNRFAAEYGLAVQGLYEALAA